MMSRLAPLLVLAIGLGGYFWLEQRKEPVVKKVAASPAKMQASKKLSSELLETPREPIKESPKVKISAECSKTWNDIQALKSEDFQNLKFPNLSSCQNVPAQFSQVMMQYLNACKNVLNGGVDLPNREKNDCRSAMYTYRATITDYLTRDQPIDQVSDLRVLIDKLIASFGAGDLDTDRMLEAAERIHHLAPELYEPLKAMVVARFGPIFKGEKDPVRLAEAFASIEKSVQEAEEFNSADPDLWEARFLARSRLGQDLDRADQVVSEMRQVKGLEGLSDYFQAGVEWRRGNAEVASQFLERAIKRDPENERYLDSREKMKAAKPGAKDVFQSSIRFSFDFDVDRYKN